MKRSENFDVAQSSFKTTNRPSMNNQLKLTQLFCVATLQFKGKGKMNFNLYAILTTLLYLSSGYSSVEIRPELQKNILRFGYGINYKYEGMLAHSFERFCVDDLKLSLIRYDKECKYIYY